MINFNEEVRRLKSKYDISDSDFELSLTNFLVSNNWFGEDPILESDSVFVSDDFIRKQGHKIETYCRYFGADTQTKVDFLESKIEIELPETHLIFDKYCDVNEFDSNIVYMILDFLLYNLPGEIRLSTDAEIGTLVEAAFDGLPRVYGEVLTDFINWIKLNWSPKPIFKNLYFLKSYSTRSENNDAYEQEYYLKILYCMFNEDYIEENDMYGKAAESKNYIDTWLFIALHFLCAIRYTDLVRFPHPKLPMPAEEVLEQVKNGTFSKANAKYVLCTITQYMATVSLKPNKTKAHTGVSNIKFHVPESIETHIGTLFAIAQAHFELNGLDPEIPLIRAIKTYEQINRYMGEEIGELFLESNFRARAANKSFMQMIYLLTDDVLDSDDEFKVNGYILASMARSHKGAYGEFASTTSTYLKDAKMSGYSAEFVAKELLERGVLSCMSSMLLRMITGGEYQKLSIDNQTKLINELNLNPSEIENSVSIMQDSVKQATAIVQELYCSTDKKELLGILHRIGNGDAVSKQYECLCLMTAMKKPCPYPERSSCISCQYEISTKSTMLLMVSELRRLSLLYQTSDNAKQKERYKSLAKNTVAPKVTELLMCMKEQYGQSAVDDMEEIARKVNNGK